MMKTIQMTLDEELLDQVDRDVKRLGTTRSRFIRESLHYFLKRSRAEQLEKKQAEGYRKRPVQKGEFDLWEDEQVWD